MGQEFFCLIQVKELVPVNPQNAPRKLVVGRRPGRDRSGSGLGRTGTIRPQRASAWDRADRGGGGRYAQRRGTCPRGEAPSRTSSGGLPEGFHLLPGGMPGAHGRARLCQGYRRRSVRRSLPHRAGPEPFRLHPRPLRSVAFMSALTPVPLRKTSRERRGRALSLPQQRPCWISLRRRSLRLGTALKRTDPDRLPDCVKKAFRSAWRRVGRVWI